MHIRWMLPQDAGPSTKSQKCRFPIATAFQKEPISSAVRSRKQILLTTTMLNLEVSGQANATIRGIDADSWYGASKIISSWEAIALAPIGSGQGFDPNRYVRPCNTASGFMVFKPPPSLDDPLCSVPHASSCCYLMRPRRRILPRHSIQQPALYSKTCTNASANAPIFKTRMLMSRELEVKTDAQICTYIINSKSQTISECFGTHLGIDHPIDRTHTLHR